MALMSEPVVSLQDDTRKQLGAFLRARRESLDPQRLGLPRSGRRRTPGLRPRLGRRDDVLPIFVSYFRAAMAEHRGDPLWEAKLARFFAVSEEFKTLWHQRHDVRGVENQLKLFTHPELGDFTLQQMYWYSAPRNGSRLLVYLPVDEAGERAMEWLAERGAV